MKLFSKIASAIFGIAMAIGVGVAVSGVDSKSVKAASETDTITAANLAATSTTYTNFSGVSITSSAVYAGNSAKDSSGNIQMRSKNSNSGIVSTTSGGTVKSVTITVGSGSNTIDVYGSNTAYSAASDLYASGTQGTKVGSVSATGTVTFTDDYTYVGIRSNNGAIYVTSVAIVWDTGSGPEKADVDLSVTGSSTMEFGASQTLAVSASSSGTPVSGLTYTFVSSKESVLTVTNTGVVTAAGYGTATINVTSESTDDYKAGSGSIEITVPESGILINLAFPVDGQTPVSAYDKSWTATDNGYEVTIFGANNNNNGWDYIKMGSKKGATEPYVITPQIAEEIESVIIVFGDTVVTDKITSAVLLIDDDSEFGSATEVNFKSDIAADTTVTITVPDGVVAQNLYYKLSFSIDQTTNNGDIKIMQIKYKEADLKPQLNITDTDANILTTCSVEVGETLTLIARDANPVSGVTWSVADTSVLSYEPNGYAVYITGAAEGETTLTVSKEGYKSATIPVTVSDSSLKEMEIWDADAKAPSVVDYKYKKTGTIPFYACDAGSTALSPLSDVTWSSSVTSIATIGASTGELTTLALGRTTLTATKEGYHETSVEISINKGPLTGIEVSGSMTKTSYTTSDASWDASGLVVTATYEEGYEVPVTSSVAWEFNPAVPALDVTSVVATATYQGKTASSTAQTVSVTESHAGTAEDPFTVAEGIAKCQEIGQTASGDWYVKGYITAVTSTAADADKYGNATFNLADSVASSDILIAFQVKNIGGAAFTTETFNAFAADAVGKIAVVHGPLVNYKGNTPEFNGKGTSSLVSVEDAPTGDIDVTFTAFANCEVGASGTFAASTTATNPVYTWSVDDSTIMTVDASTGVYSAKKVGVVIVTVNVSADEGEGHASAAITVNGSVTDLTSIAEANSIAASLGTGKTTSYYVYVGGYVKEFGTSMSGDKPRAFDIMNFDEEYSIMVYTNVDPYEDFVSGLSLGDYVIVKANIQNYGGVYELTSPEKISSEYTGVSFAFELLEQTDAVCSNVEIEDKGAALEEIWPSLKTLYDGIDPDLQEDVIYSSTDEKGTTLQKAMARYDRLVTKYGLTNFVVGRDPYSLNNSTSVVTNNNNSTSSIVVVTVIALTSISAIAVLLVIKRRKTY